MAPLFPVSPSLSALTLAVLVTTALQARAVAAPASSTMNTTSAVAPAGVTSVGNVQVTTPPASLQIGSELTASKVNPVGTSSVTTTFIAFAGPVLLTWNS